MELETGNTERGFGIVEFTDLSGERGSIQESSLATDDAIWFGVTEVKPQRLASATGAINPATGEMSGWVDYPIPDDVLLSGRLHLNREQVAALIPVLQRFVDTGSINPPTGARMFEQLTNAILNFETKWREKPARIVFSVKGMRLYHKEAEALQSFVTPPRGKSSFLGVPYSVADIGAAFVLVPSDDLMAYWIEDKEREDD